MFVHPLSTYDVGCLLLARVGAMGTICTRNGVI